MKKQRPEPAWDLQLRDQELAAEAYYERLERKKEENGVA